MRFVKGLIVGSLITTSAIMMMCGENDMMMMDKKRMIKKGRQFIKKMGIV